MHARDVLFMIVTEKKRRRAEAEQTQDALM